MNKTKIKDIIQKRLDSRKNGKEQYLKSSHLMRILSGKEKVNVTVDFDARINELELLLEDLDKDPTQKAFISTPKGSEDWTK